MTTATRNRLPSPVPADPDRPCALCGRTDTATVNSAGYLGTALNARICRDWRACGK